MDRFIVTGFTSGYWNTWGPSWFGSLEEFSQSSANKIVVTLDEFPENVLSKLETYDVKIVPSQGNSRQDILQALDSLIEIPGIYAYFDGDVYFQEEIYALFEMASQKMVVAENLNPGMIVAPSHIWSLFLNFSRATQLVRPTTVVESLAAFCKHFGHFVNLVPNIWNWTDLPSLCQVGYHWGHRGVVANVVHPSGVIKKFPETKPYLFENKYPDIFNRWNSIFSKSSHGLKRVVVQPTKTQFDIASL